MCAHHQNKKTEQIPKLLSYGFIFLSTLYLSPCLGIHDVQITGNCICQSKKKKKKSPQSAFFYFYFITPRQKEITQSFPGSVFFKNLSLWGPFSLNKRKNEFSAKIRLR